jgi:hypothetical protein
MYRVINIHVVCVYVCVRARAHVHMRDDDVNTTHTNEELIKTSQENWDKSHFPFGVPPIILPFIHSYTLYLLQDAMTSVTLNTHTQ